MQQVVPQIVVFGGHWQLQKFGSGTFGDGQDGHSHRQVSGFNAFGEVQMMQVFLQHVPPLGHRPAAQGTPQIPLVQRVPGQQR